MGPIRLLALAALAAGLLAPPAGALTVRAVGAPRAAAGAADPFPVVLGEPALRVVLHDPSRPAALPTESVLASDEGLEGLGSAPTLPAVAAPPPATGLGGSAPAPPGSELATD